MSFASDVKKLEKRIDYKGCRNCEYQIEPLRRCEWAEKKTETSIHLICPKWKKKGEYHD